MDSIDYSKGISKGEMLKAINEPFKIGICRKCSKQRTVTKATGICQKCAPKLKVVSNDAENETDRRVGPKPPHRIAQEPRK